MVFDIKKIMSYSLLIGLLSAASIGIYLIQIAVFHKQGDTEFYFLQDLAFIPIQVLIVTLILNKLVEIVGRRQNRKKVNVIISAFFSETGTSLVYELSKFVGNIDEFCATAGVKDLKKFINYTKKNIAEFDFNIHVTPEGLEALSLIVINKKPFMISMLENSSLLEHDSFTDMLWAVFHIADELQSRNLKELSEADLNHLSKDILRAYKLIVMEWLAYMKYLKAEYPYLYDLALRQNPFNQKVHKKTNTI